MSVGISWVWCFWGILSHIWHIMGYCRCKIFGFSRFEECSSLLKHVIWSYLINRVILCFRRYLGITRPLTYPAKQNGQLMAKMIVGVWLVSASITLPPFCGWAQNINTAGVCLISQDVGYTLYSTAVAFYIPMVVMLFMYYKIFKAARKSGARHHFTALPLIQKACPDPALATVEVLCMHGMKNSAATEEFSTLSCLLNRERRIASIFRREQKAATTLGVIMGVFSFCWLPFFLFTTARPFICGLLCNCAPVWLERVLLWLGYTNSLVNPFIYAFFNRDLRSTYKDLLRCRYRNINRRLSAMGVHEALKLWLLTICLYDGMVQIYIFLTLLQVKGIVHPKMKILSSFTHPQVVSNLYEFLCSAKHKEEFFFILKKVYNQTVLGHHSQNCSVSHSLQNIFLCVRQNKDIHTGLELLQDDDDRMMSSEMMTELSFLGELSV